MPRPIIALGVVLLAVTALRFAASPRSAYAQHPDPRPGITGDGVLPQSRYAQAPMVSNIYGLAREIPEVLDGLYCYCDCSKHSGHRSLLTCFQSDHGAGCDICLNEAELAYRMHTQGASLQAIRDAIDEAWGHS